MRFSLSDFARRRPRVTSFCFALVFFILIRIAVDALTRPAESLPRSSSPLVEDV